MRCVLVFIAACAGAPAQRPADPMELQAPAVAHARIALKPDPALWFDVTVESWHAREECRQLVNRQLRRLRLASDDVVRACDAEPLPRLAAYHLVTRFERGLLDAPNSLYTLETVVPVESSFACEARKTDLELQDEIAWVEDGIVKQREMEKQIAETKRICAEAHGFEPACLCEVVQRRVTFRPVARECRASH